MALKVAGGILEEDAAFVLSITLCSGLEKIQVPSIMFYSFLVSKTL